MLSQAREYHSAMTKPYIIRAEWDTDACVWVATSDDVPGLVAEADTVEALDARLQALVPELLELNGCLPPGDAIQFAIHARRFTVINLVTT